MAYQLREIDETMSGSHRDLTITRNFFCEPYSGVGGALLDALGGYYNIGGGILQVQPARHPVFPWCRVSGFNVSKFTQPIGQTAIAGVAALERTLEAAKCQLSLTYSMPTLTQGTLDNQGGGQNSDEEIELASESYDFGGKELQLDNDYFVIASTNRQKASKNSNVFKTIPEMTMQLVRHRCIKIPFLTIAALTNTINKSTFNIGITRTSFPSDIVRFEGCGAQRKITTAQGFQFYEITYKFAVLLTYDWTYTAIGDTIELGFPGWNRVWDEEEDRYDFYTHSKSGRKSYLYDEDVVAPVTVGGVLVNGFRHLFNPLAS